MTGDRLVDPGTVLAELKDFQRRTAEWVFERMFSDDDPATRFLVADEVGLGKTHVAKGVVAQVIDHLRGIGDRRHDIVYICSNAAIARQNLRKLVPKGIDPLEGVERLTMLPTVDLATGADGGSGVNLLAITPGTSLSFGHRTGTFAERSLAYEFLSQLWGRSVMTAPARRIFWRGISADDPDRRLRNYGEWFGEAVTRNIDRFGSVLGDADRRRESQGSPPLRELFDDLTHGLAWKRSFPDVLKEPHRQFIAEIRRVMAIVGITALQPDLVILDEFQRFKDLLQPNPEDFATDLAHRLFDHVDVDSGRRTRTLLLSATPYRMYSTVDDLDGNHYEDFLATCRFLLGSTERVDRLSDELSQLRRALTSSGPGLADAAKVCERISADLRKVMVRTERLAATPDRDGMLVERHAAAVVTPDDVRGYLRIGDITQWVGQHEPTEYWKSAPFLLNFMDHYQLKSVVRQAAADGVLQPEERLTPGPGLLDWDDVVAYQQIDPQNGRLRWLLADLHEHRAFELLWIPPSLRYYDTGSVYESPEATRFTKRLIFSGWGVVPKAVSSLVTYEAERVVYRSRQHRYTSDYRRRGGNRLQFRMAARRRAEHRPGEAEGQRRAAAMTAFALTWPSPVLADLGDPRSSLSSVGTKHDVLRAISDRVTESLRPLLTDAPNTGAVDARWYWAAPLLLDARQRPESVAVLLSSAGPELWDGPAAGEGIIGHVAEANALVAAGHGALGRPPDDLAEVVAELALGSPAVCALRALAAATGLPVCDPGLIGEAARVSGAFRRFFNAPEVTAIVSLAPPVVEADEDDGVGDLGDADVDDTVGGYWREVLRHSIDGNIQALLDEHAHVLRDWRGHLHLDTNGERIDAARDLTDAIVDALDLRNSSFNVDIPRPSERGQGVGFDEHRMRTRFAVAYGTQRFDDGGEARVEALSTAFNAPFWPFVLVSTSVGQEGLDFHLWCHAVVHWNLPTNPVDLEQREGRVHRFKGHAVRRNIAATLGANLAHWSESGDPELLPTWDRLFHRAVESRSAGDNDMVPYWVFPEGPHKIERHVPTLPFSRDAASLAQLRKTLAAYRLAFGQPRQEELIDLLGASRTDTELLELARRLRIDLSPPPAD